MARICKVCERMDRAEIDAALSMQVLNLSELSRRFGVSRDSLRAHRASHLPSFLPALVSRAQAPAPDTLHAELQRLYLVALDELARAQAGVTISRKRGKDGRVREVRRVNTAAVARMISEARKTVDAMGRLTLAHTERNETTSARNTPELDAALTRALERANTLRMRDGIDDAMVIDAQDEDGAHTLHECETNDVRTVGPGAGSGPGADCEVGDPHFSDAAKSQSGSHAESGNRDGSETPTVPPVTRRALPSGEIRYPVWTGNPAASPEERKAAGYEPIPVFYPPVTHRADDGHVPHAQPSPKNRHSLDDLLRQSGDEAQQGTSDAAPESSE